MPDRIAVELPDGVRLNVESHGPTDAPLTVLLLHGWTLDAPHLAPPGRRPAGRRGAPGADRHVRQPGPRPLRR